MKSEELIRELSAALLAALPKKEREKMVALAVEGLVGARGRGGGKPKKSAAPAAPPVQSLVRDAVAEVARRVIVELLLEDAETMTLLRARLGEVVRGAIEDGRVEAIYRTVEDGALARLRR